MNTSSANILVTGGDGQIASALKRACQKQPGNFIFCPRNELDITSPESLHDAFEQYQPTAIINTAAYTAVDRAESQHKEALVINYHGASTLALACKKHQTLLIHLSTDYVFDGKKELAYNEEDATHPINAYGNSKLLGEEAIRNCWEQHIILRVSGVFSEYRTNFLKSMLSLASEKKSLRIVNDQFTCPTYAGDIANTLIALASHPRQTGTYHYCSNHPVSWHGFAAEILQQAGITSVPVEPIPTSEYPTPAKRPVNSVLDCSKIKNDYAISQPNWKKGIRNTLAAL